AFEVAESTIPARTPFPLGEDHVFLEFIHATACATDRAPNFAITKYQRELLQVPMVLGDTAPRLPFNLVSENWSYSQRLPSLTLWIHRIRTQLGAGALLEMIRMLPGRRRNVATPPRACTNAERLH
ncbi:hypothetical protein MPER_07679, partial [Moniliophthora perniciosa FA553]